MKKIIVLIVLIFTSSLFLYAQEVSLFTHWKKGDIQKLLVKEGTVVYNNDVVTKKNITQSSVLLTVLEETDKTYTIAWSYYDYQEDKLNVKEEPQHEIFQRMEEAFQEIRLIYQINKSGEYLGILNFDETIQPMMDSLSVFVAESDMNEREREFMTIFIKETVNSNRVKKNLTRDIRRYHHFYGATFFDVMGLSYIDTLNRLKQNIPAIGLLTLTVDTTTKIITINDSHTMDKTITKQGVKESVDKIADKLNMPSKEEEKILKRLEKTSVAMKEEKIHTYNYELGWLKYYLSRRVVNADELETIKFYSIEEIE